MQRPEGDRERGPANPEGRGEEAEPRAAELLAGRGSRRAEKKAVSRRRILEAARQVFFRDGFMAANLDEMASRAGVAKGTLYRYFRSKAELYVAVLAHNGEIFERKMRETISPELTAAEQIWKTGRFYLDHWTTHRDYFQIFWAIENQSVIGELPDAVIDEVARLWEACVQIVAEVVAEGVRRGQFRECDPWEVANILWTLANGLIEEDASATRRDLRRRKLDQTFEHAFEIVLRGIAAEDEPGA